MSSKPNKNQHKKSKPKRVNHSNPSRCRLPQEKGTTKSPVAPPMAESVEEPSIPIDAHEDANSSSSDELHLVSCKDVAFEVRDGAPGVKFKKNDEKGWTQ